MDYKIIKKNFDRGLWSKDQVKKSFEKGFLTEEEYNKILKKDIENKNANKK